jgi:hypothetical protein
MILELTNKKDEKELIGINFITRITKRKNGSNVWIHGVGIMESKETPQQIRDMINGFGMELSSFKDEERHFFSELIEKSIKQGKNIINNKYQELYIDNGSLIFGNCVFDLDNIRLKD